MVLPPLWWGGGAGGGGPYHWGGWTAQGLTHIIIYIYTHNYIHIHIKAEMCCGVQLYSTVFLGFGE